MGTSSFKLNHECAMTSDSITRTRTRTHILLYYWC